MKSCLKAASLQLHFLEIASFSQGQVLNMSAIAREASISQKNVSNYFDILEDLLIGYRLPVFTSRKRGGRAGNLVFTVFASY